MAWTIEYSDNALKELNKLNKQIARKVLDYMDEKVAVLDDPTSAGKTLTGKLGAFHRYRIGDIRVVCYIHKEAVTVLVLRVAHRSKVYFDETAIAEKASREVDLFRQKIEERDRSGFERELAEDLASLKSETIARRAKKSKPEDETNDNQY